MIKTKKKNSNNSSTSFIPGFYIYHSQKSISLYKSYIFHFPFVSSQINTMWLVNYFLTILLFTTFFAIYSFPFQKN